ncbi:glucosamine--fructose-6-phosphate aminotransferase [Brucella endophytica]|uniref:Glucosamine--fructose-6-phosphate aminotransferase n=1 Tax=Brucella endophytica TaxID=1963359 RepID=A0A916WHD4_9HYPH|nr:SIS domain-containing protein [Brucella endophytica]GGA97797.1 glucosamine--fructose-6-phosphate aminotransferase [Brucella endophytica]
MTETTLMRAEISSIPEVVARFLDASDETMRKAGDRLREKNPAFLASIARGSSDHAATYLKYVAELTAGVPVASLGPSVASIYGAKLKLASAAAIAISQSGKSPDIVTMATMARESGALTYAISNAPDSPLAQASDVAIDILAGPEKSVAATKTFIASAVAGLSLLAHWTGDTELLAALRQLPRFLSDALHCDWSPLANALEGRDSLYVLGRGPSFAIANETALKFKETSSIHAEAYSAAEVLHGPVAIVGEAFPVLALAARDQAEQSVIETCDRIAGQGAAVFITSTKETAATALPFVATAHPLTDPLALLVSFYGFVEQLSRHRGFNPDQPPHLRKVTETI